MCLINLIQKTIIWQRLQGKLQEYICYNFEINIEASSDRPYYWLKCILWNKRDIILKAQFKNTSLLQLFENLILYWTKSDCCQNMFW